MDKKTSFAEHPETLLALQSGVLHQGAASVQQLEQRSFNAWPASKNAIMGHWLLRSHHGYSKRANSANALQPGAGLNDQLLRHIEAWYARQHLPCIFRLSPLADDSVDALLHADGYQLLEPSVFMQRPTNPVDSAWQPKPGIEFTADSQPSDLWVHGYSAAKHQTPAQLEAQRALLQSISAPCVYMTLFHEGQACAWGLAVLERVAVGLYEVLVRPGLRSSGLGHQLLCCLLKWACEQGASHADLQVLNGNVPAQSLYSRLGFQTVYGYHYRIKR